MAREGLVEGRGRRAALRVAGQETRPLVRDDPRLDRLLERNGARRREDGLVVRVPDVPAGAVPDDVPQEEAQVVEGEDPLELAREGPDQLLGVADRAQDLRDPEEQPVALLEGNRGLRGRLAAHPHVTLAASVAHLPFPPEHPSPAAQKRKVSPV